MLIASLATSLKDYVKYLGLMIDSNLSWKYHIESICHKISKSIGIISKIRYYVPRRVLLSVYNSLISPYLTYGICGWRNCALAFQRKIVTLRTLLSQIELTSPSQPIFSEIVAFYCRISLDRQLQLVYSINLLKQDS